jgi:hypothetical protein
VVAAEAEVVDKRTNKEVNNNDFRIKFFIRLLYNILKIIKNRLI